jgi:hypothetical protein
MENRHLFHQLVDIRENHVEEFNAFLILLTVSGDNVHFSLVMSIVIELCESRHDWLLYNDWNHQYVVC